MAQAWRKHGASRTIWESRHKVGKQLQAGKAGKLGKQVQACTALKLPHTSHLLSVDLRHQEPRHRASPQGKAEHIGHSASKGNGAGAGGQLGQAPPRHHGKHGDAHACEADSQQLHPAGLFNHAASDDGAHHID